MPKISILAIGAVSAAIAGLAAPAFAQGQATAAPAKNNYADDATWLCRPGRKDACTVNLDATVVRGDGTTSVRPFKPAADPKIDCFYVYPTVSNDPTPNSDMNPGPEEISVIKQQFARFAEVCRTFAPMYRQVTLTALKANMFGKPMAGVDRALGYNDVKDAWNYYLEHDNQGRGVVLIGHSQGSGVLTQLVKNEIDGKPIQARIVSVILGGSRLQVPIGKDVGGDFKSIPLCHSATQVGCAMNFASFRAEAPPPGNSLFGASSGAGMEAACVNPAALGGGKGELHAYMASGAENIAAGNTDSEKPRAWTDPPVAITTPFVEVPGMLSAECAKDATGKTYLSILTNPNLGGKRTTKYSGDVVVGGQVQANWGLHLIDMNLTMGNLIDDVRSEGATYLKGGR
jgi:hypothetical protein